MSQYFQLFDLPKQFSQDIKQLEHKYHILAAQFHPDKFSTSSSFEQKQAMMMTSTINEAYRVLKNPIDRASYILSLHNIDAEAPEHTSFEPEFLMKQMQWREELDEASSMGDLNAIESLKKTIINSQSELYDHLEFNLNKSYFDEAANLVRQGRFLEKMLEQINQLS